VGAHAPKLALPRAHAPTPLRRRFSAIVGSEKFFQVLAFFSCARIAGMALYASVDVK